MLSFTDQVGRTIQFVRKPQRIISLVPSQTELLFDLGLNEEVIGITKFCIHPQQWFHQKTRVGGTKQLKMEIIRELNPDLILANKEENVKEQVEELALTYPVWISEVNDLGSAIEMITQIGAIIGKERNALLLTNKIRNNFDQLEPGDKKIRTAYLIWQHPYMTVGRDTFISAMMEIAGFENVFKKTQRYPEISILDIADAGCDVVFLSSEPFPFNQKHLEEIQKQLSGTKVMLVDGEMFSWYGSRLKDAPGYFKKLRELLN